MNWSFKLGSVRGIEIRVHITFLLILIYAAWFWSGSVDSALRGAVFGIVATLLLFACVTLHELGHSFQAMAYGIQTRDITLLPIGGVARLERIPEEPKQEFRIAIAGPLVNVVIAIILVIVMVAIGSGDLIRDPGTLLDRISDGTAIALLSYLLFANIYLVLFNLIPAFPMDGGRIFRSLLAMRLPFARATRIAALVGQAMALLLGFVGLATTNFFLVLIALFVWFGAGQENAMAQAKKAIGTMDVRQAMSANPAQLEPGDPLSRAVGLTLSTAQADFPVLDRNGYVIGFLSLDGLLKALQDRPTATVGEAMRRDFPVARPGDPLLEASERLNGSGQRAMPVLSDDGHLVGLLTANDIGEALRLMAVQPELFGPPAAEPPVEKVLV